MNNNLGMANFFYNFQPQVGFAYGQMEPVGMPLFYLPVFNVAD